MQPDVLFSLFNSIGSSANKMRTRYVFGEILKQHIGQSKQKIEKKDIVTLVIG